MDTRRVLVVEDNIDTRKWLVSCVEQAFDAVEVVATGDVASTLAELRGWSFDLALVDLGLPDGSGLEIIGAIRSADGGPATYIVVATIYDDDKNLFTALKSGAQGYILKDQDRDRVVSYLQGIPRGETPLSNKVATRIVAHFNQRADAKNEYGLAPREEDVLRFIAKGFSVADTAGLLGLTNNTVKGYVKTIYSKLGVSSRAEATVEAIRLGIVDVE